MTEWRIEPVLPAEGLATVRTAGPEYATGLLLRVERGIFAALVPIVATAAGDRILVAVPRHALPASAPVAPDGEPLLVQVLANRPESEGATPVDVLLVVLERAVLDAGRVFNL